MAGGILKTLGGLLIIVGALGLLAGLAAAGYGYVDERENRDQLLPESDRSDVNEALLTYGLLSAAASLLVLVVGILVAVVGGARAQAALRREIREGRPAASGAQAAPVGGARRGWVAAGVLGAVLLAGLLGAAAFQGGIGAFAAGSSAAAADADGSGETFLGQQSFSGRVTNAASEPLGSSHTVDATESIKEFDAPVGTSRLLANLTWTTVDGGADDLRILVEVFELGAWRELARQGGGSPVVVETGSPGLDAAHLRYRVFPNADASVVVDQPFSVKVGFFGVAPP